MGSNNIFHVTICDFCSKRFGFQLGNKSPISSMHNCFNFEIKIETKEMIVKPATINDAKEMHNIHTNAVRKTCKDFYTQKQIDAWLEGRTPEGYNEGINKGDMYVAEEDGKIVGFGHAIPGEIVAIFVDTTSHKKGIGKLLLDYGLKIALKGHQKVKVESTVNAEGFYKKHGFVKIRDDVHVKRGVESPIVVLEYSAT